MKKSVLTISFILFLSSLVQAQPQEVFVSTDSTLIFGLQVAMGGEYAAVNFVTLTENGAIVYKQNGDEWAEVDRIVGDSDATSNDPQPFTSLAMDGDRIIAGDGAYDFPTGVNQGLAYIFRRDGDDWIREGELAASDGDGQDDFGVSGVGISGEVAIVGTPNDDDNGNESGSAYIFRFNGTTWVEEIKLTPSDGVEEQEFGISVDIDGTVAIVGVLIDSELAAAAGAAYVFEYDGSTWTETQKLLPADPVAAGSFGASVAVDDERILIGARGATGTQAASGAAYVFEKEGSQWVEQAKLSGADAVSGSFFGTSVSLEGDCAGVGAFSQSVETGGAAYTFVNVNGSWNEVAKVKASNGSGNNQFGWTVSTSNGNLIAGAPFADVNNSTTFTGAAYIYNDACQATTTSIDDAGFEVVENGRLHQNFPNPFSSVTSIPFTLEAPGHVTLSVYNVLGQKVDELLSGVRPSGEYVIEFNSTDLPGGIYFYHLEYDQKSLVRKMTILE